MASHAYREARRHPLPKCTAQHLRVQERALKKKPANDTKGFHNNLYNQERHLKRALPAIAEVSYQEALPVVAESKHEALPAVAEVAWKVTKQGHYLLSASACRWLPSCVYLLSACRWLFSFSFYVCLLRPGQASPRRQLKEDGDWKLLSEMLWARFEQTRCIQLQP